MNELGYLQLHLVKDIGPATIRRFLSRLRQTGTSLDEFFRLPPKEQMAQYGLGAKQTQALDLARLETEKTYAELQRRGVKLLVRGTAAYPAQLEQRLGEHSPPLLYAWGNLELLNKKAVGFCGARDVSEKGLSTATDCAAQIASWGWVVVSGGARGVDTAVHNAALTNGGGTIIVLPEGILRYQLRGDLKSLVTKKNALLISEFPPHLTWSVGCAMQRNWTVCGLSDALVIIEAREAGGTFEAGKLALRLKIPLFVADYAKPAMSAVGNAYFLTRGAHALRRNVETGRANLEALRRVVEAIDDTTTSTVQLRML